MARQFRLGEKFFKPLGRRLPCLKEITKLLVQNLVHANPSSSGESSIQRIGAALGVATAQLERLPGRSLERIAILCENEFRHYPRKLRLVEVSGLVRAAGNYRFRDATIRLRVKLDAERYIHVCAHEFAHAILARCDASTLAEMKRVVTAVRRENLQALGEFFWSIRHADYLRAFFLCNDFVENGQQARYPASVTNILVSR